MTGHMFPPATQVRKKFRLGQDRHDEGDALLRDVAGHGRHSCFEVRHEERERDSLDSGAHGRMARGRGLSDAGDQVRRLEPVRDRKTGGPGERAQVVR